MYTTPPPLCSCSFREHHETIPNTTASSWSASTVSRTTAFQGHSWSQDTRLTHNQLSELEHAEEHAEDYYPGLFSAPRT